MGTGGWVVGEVVRKHAAPTWSCFPSAGAAASRGDLVDREDVRRSDIAAARRCRQSSPAHPPRRPDSVSRSGRPGSRHELAPFEPPSRGGAPREASTAVLPWPSDCSLATGSRAVPRMRAIPRSWAHRQAHLVDGPIRVCAVDGSDLAPGRHRLPVGRTGR